ncbi:PAS domain-containing protein, partial [Candidatus Calescamantes bacterium]|nr:PAS domain-containing protein [Candidatus Calescamantes bacterium]
MNKKNVKTGGKMNSEPRSELLHQYHLLIESAKLAVIEFDKAGKMVWANRNALETLGVSDASKAGSIADVIRKEGVFDIMGNPLLPETLPMNIVATQKIPVTDFKCSLEISKGKRIMYSINMVPLLDK